MIAMSLYKSILRLCDDFKEAQALEGRPLSVINFDAHADENTLPRSDVIGISGFSLETDVFTTMTVMVGICTVDDTNLMRLMELIDALYDKLQPDTKHDVYNPNTGVVKGFMNVLDGIQLMPVSGSLARPLQYIAVRFATSCFTSVA